MYQVGFQIFNLSTHKQTNAQVWAKLYDLPMEYRGQTNLFGIVRGVGMPLKVDPLTLQKKTGPYCWVLLYVNCSIGLPDKLLVQRKAAGVMRSHHSIVDYAKP